MQVRGTQSFSVIRAIHGAHLSGQRFALLKIAPGNFFMFRDVSAVQSLSRDLQMDLLSHLCRHQLTPPGMVQGRGEVQLR